MTDEQPPAIATLLARIVAPEPASAAAPPPWTGALAELATWWATVAPEQHLVPVDVVVAGTSAPASQAALAGAAEAERAVDAGATLLVPRAGSRDDVAARAVIVLLTKREPSAVLPQPEGMPDGEWMRTCAAIRDAAASAAHLRGDPLALLDALGASGIAGVTGILLGAAARRTPCLIDGTDEHAAALVADRLCYRASGWWRAGATSADPARAAAADRIDLSAGLPLGLTDDEGQGAAATLALLRLTVDRSA